MTALLILKWLGTCSSFYTKNKQIGNFFVKVTLFFFIRHEVRYDRERAEKVFKKRLYTVFPKMLTNGNSLEEFSLRGKCQYKAEMKLQPTFTEQSNEDNTHHHKWSERWRKTKQTSRHGFKQPKILRKMFCLIAGPCITSWSHQLTFNQHCIEMEYTKC